MAKFEHPEGKILLLNGKAIGLYEKKNKGIVPEFSGMQLDTTGKYLQIGPSRKSKHPKSEPDPVITAHRELFRRNAIELYHHKDIVYSDSRIFLTPIDMGCHLAYTGPSGFTGATLGVWLEWWDALPICREDEDGKERLITCFAGSPLTGANCCSGVLPSGETVDVRFVHTFHDIFRKFLEINRRYYGLGEKYEFYPLEKTLKKLGLNR